MASGRLCNHWSTHIASPAHCSWDWIYFNSTVQFFVCVSWTLFSEKWNYFWAEKIKFVVFSHNTKWGVVLRFIDFTKHSFGCSSLCSFGGAGNGRHTHWIALVQHCDGVANSLGPSHLPTNRYKMYKINLYRGTSEKRHNGTSGLVIWFWGSHWW